MADKVRAAGGEVETRQYPGLSHALLVGALAAPLRGLAPVLADVAGFVRTRADSLPTMGRDSDAKRRRVGASEALAIPQRGACVTRLPHPDRFAVFPSP
jgi:hypothetical protein